MEKERKITAPEGCEIKKVELIDGVAVVTFKEKETQLPKTWEEFCQNSTREGKFYINSDGIILNASYFKRKEMHPDNDRTLLPDRETAEAVLALCQLIQLRECYNQGWMPNWKDDDTKFVITFEYSVIESDCLCNCAYSPLYFKSSELRDLFLENFRPLIEKLKPLYGIMEGGDNK